MASKFRAHLTYANVVSSVCLFVVLGGSSYAAISLSKNSVKSKHIAKGAVKRSDIGKNAVNSSRVADSSLRATDFAPGQLSTGPKGDKGDKGDAGAQGLPGAAGTDGTDGTARAHARVAPHAMGAGCSGGALADECSFDHSKGITKVTRLSEGRYCVTAPGVSSASAPAAVSVDWGTTTGPEGNALAMSATGIGCGVGQFGVVTERHPQFAANQGAGTNNVTVLGSSSESDNVGFTIVIP